MKIMSSVRDLVLNYAYNVAKNKAEDKKEFQGQFLSGLKILRERYPELLFVNYNNSISDDESKGVFLSIKSKVSERYRLSYIPSSLSFVEKIGDQRIEIPGLINIEKGGYLCIRYDNHDIKKKLLNQVLLHLLIQLPIKKIQFSFVDLSGDYDEDFFIKNVDPSIYHGRPITSDIQLEELLENLEQRRFDVTQKYGEYSVYCQEHSNIPIPYEFVVLLDDNYDDRFRQRLNKIISTGYKYGVYLIIMENTSRFQFPDNCFFNPNGNEIYYSPFFGADDEESLIFTGDFYCRPHKQRDCIPHLSSSGDDLILNDFIAKGYGDYEVVLSVGEIYENTNVQSLYSIFCNKMGIPQNRLDKMMNTGTDIVLAAFPTEEEANEYIDKLCMQYRLPEYITCSENNIYFEPCWRKGGFLSDNIHMGLWVPQSTCNNISEYRDDLKFYMNELGVTDDLFERMILCISGGISLPGATRYIDSFETYERADNGLEMLQNMVVGHLQNNMDYCLYNFGKDNEVYIDEDIVELRPFSGIAISYWNDPKFDKEEKCRDYIFNIEHELHNRAIKKWGDQYYRSHLIIGRTPPGMISAMEEDFYRLRVCKRPHNKKTFWKYEIPKSNGLINYTPITSNETLLKACFEYIRTEAEAKEEMKVQTLDFSSAAACKYETDLSSMIIPVGKAESKDADFRLDVVSHIHSFIIGQSGSGKSVFLHNIIGGAMLKYAPEDLQLYLLDFKLGGVEFNRYQGAKHVKALLVDNSDPQVTLEILRELRGNMTERGKLLRSAGVNNIGEYNKLHQEDRMPHVLVVADECHEMFKADDSIPRQVRNEISDIVIKIAKEGRSQGIHLVFATQTLSGTEISSEIINNVSDFYLLKCAQTDSERLVPNSSAITSDLSTGQIYYHHVDEQVKFQAYYTDKEAAEKLMAAIVEKAKDHKSNGEFYFNGAQMFYLDESVKEQMLAVKGKSPLAFMGKAIDISQKDLYIKLNEDFSENVLLLGLNDQEQVTRTTMNLFVSLMMSAKLKHKDIAFKVIDCLNNEEGEVHELIFDLENEGYCEIIERRQRSKFFKELAQSVLDGTAEETILLILGQDRFRELKMDMELEESNSRKSSDDDDMMSISDDFFGDSSSSSTSVRTYRDAMNVILEKGPDYGVHTLLQIEKASNLLFEDYITPKVVFQKFKHLVMLKSDETAGVTLHLNDDICLEKLSSDWERLRAYYYAEESDSYTLFTPYMPSKSKDIINLLNTI